METLQTRHMPLIRPIRNKRAMSAIEIILALVIMVIFVILFWEVVSNMFSVGNHYKAYDILKNEISEVCNINSDTSRTVTFFLPKALGGPSGDSPCWKQSTSTFQGVGRGKVLSSIISGGSGSYAGLCDKTTYLSIKMLSQNIMELVGYKTDTKKEVIYKRNTLECASGIEVEPFVLSSDINVETHTIQIIKEGNVVWLNEVLYE